MPISLIHNVEVTIEPNVNLHGANLSRADLSWANLSGANLHEANLHGVNLSGADLSRIQNYVDLGIDNRGYHFRAIAFAHGWQITAGCRNFTIDKAIAHWTTADNKDALARIAILQAHPIVYKLSGSLTASKMMKRQARISSLPME